jgi:hypothetical protein
MPVGSVSVLNGTLDSALCFMTQLLVSNAQDPNSRFTSQRQVIGVLMN